MSLQKEEAAVNALINWAKTGCGTTLYVIEISEGGTKYKSRKVKEKKEGRPQNLKQVQLDKYINIKELKLKPLYGREKYYIVLLQELIQQQKITALQEKAVSLTIDYREK